MTIISTSLNPAAEALAAGSGGVRDLAAQPLAPGIFGLTWEVRQKPARLELQRRVGDGAFERAGTCDPDRTEYIDRATPPTAVGQDVTYRLVETDADGTEIASLETSARNSAELIPVGDFETDPGAVPAMTGVAVSASAPWVAEIVEGGMPPGKRCLQFSTTDPDANATFNVSTRWFIVSPRTTYHFGWWTTESAYGTSFADGQAYGMTRQRKKSFYEKTASLYVQQATRQGEWVGSSAEPRLPRDVRYVYAVLRGQGQKHPQPIRVDNLSIIDRDIELLLATDIDELLSASRAAARQHVNLGLHDQVEKLADTVESRSASLRATDAHDIDAFLDQRADLCEAIRELKRLAVIFRLAEAQ